MTIVAVCTAPVPVPCRRRRRRRSGTPAEGHDANQQQSITYKITLQRPLLTGWARSGQAFALLNAELNHMRDSWRYGGSSVALE